LIPQVSQTFDKLDQDKATLLKTKSDAAQAQQDYEGSLAAEIKAANFSPAAVGVALAHMAEVNPARATQLQQQFNQNPASAQQWVNQAIAGSPKQQQLIVEKTKGGMEPGTPQAITAQSESTIKANEAAQGGGIPVDQRALHDYLADPSIDAGKNKNAATYTAWKAKQSPMAVVMGNQLGQGGQGSALDQAAQRYSTDGSLPAGFSRSPGTTAAIIQRAAQLNPDQNIAANKATYQADAAALKKVQGTFEQVNAFEGTALKNLDLYVEKAKAIPDLGVRFANVPLRAITKGMIGDANYAAMEAARQTAATETAKVLGSATASGVLSDSQKKEALDVLDGKLPLAATIKVVDTLKQDFANRHAGYQDDINAIKQRLNPGAKPPASNSGQPTPPATPGAFDWNNMPKHQ
jgi:hypothetical protein